MITKTTTRGHMASPMQDDTSDILRRFDLPDYIARQHPSCKMSGARDSRRCVAVWRGGGNENVSIRYTGGKWKWKDHKTGEGGDAIDFLQVVEGLSKKEAYDRAREVTGTERVNPVVVEWPRENVAKPRVVGQWVYTDEQGIPLSRVVRVEPGPRGKAKGYRQEAADGAGGWRSGEGAMSGVRRVPYKLPELLAAKQATKTLDLYIPEGESCVDRLRAGGLVATCNAEGAGKWTEEHAEYCAGANVNAIVLADNDEAGRKHVTQVVKTLRGRVASIKLIELDGLPQKGDVVDWIDAGNTIDDLRALVAKARELPEHEAGKDDDDDRERSPRNVRANLDTVCAALVASQPEIGTIYLETFSGKIRLAPGPVMGGHDRPLEDTDELRLALYLQRERQMPRATDELVHKAARLIGHANQKDALTDWLDGLAWDKTDRLVTWLVSAYGVDETKSMRHIGPNWLLSMVARAYQPGAKVDNMPVLEGKQGIGKSRSLQALVPDGFYLDGEFKPADKDFTMAAHQAWLVENGELAGLNKAAQEDIKRFLSCASDAIRRPYDRSVVRLPRRFVMVGTTNESEYLSDPTGARRFWPIACRKADVEWVAANRDQLWAEAVYLYKAGIAKGVISWWNMPEEALAEQEARRMSHPWEAPILRWLNEAGRVHRREFAPDEILREAVNQPIERQSRKDQMILSGVLAPLGWTRRRDPVGKGARVNWWCRPD